MQLQYVPASHIDKAWEDGAHMLAKSCEKSGGSITPDQLKMALSLGHYDLLALVDASPIAWCVVQVSQQPNKRILYIHQIYAPRATYAEAWEQLKAYARHNGCSVIHGACNDAIQRLWERRFQAKKLYSIVEIPVTE